jgi:hypothetical protein
MPAVRVSFQWPALQIRRLKNEKWSVWTSHRFFRRGSLRQALHHVGRLVQARFDTSRRPISQPNAGLTGQGLRLATAEPGDQIAIFGEALRELTERATYLYEEAGRYWFSTQPTLNRLADDRAKAFPEHEVDAEIVKVLSDDAKIKGGFYRVFAAPDDPTSIEEAEAVSLVIMSPSMSHTGKGASKSLATDAACDALMRCRASPQLESLTIRIITLEQQNLAQERQLTRLAAIDLFLSQMDTRLARFEERQNNVLKTLDDNAKRLDAINEGLQSHIRQWPSGANGK